MTEDDSDGLEQTHVGHILGTVKGYPTPSIVRYLGISTPHSCGSFQAFAAEAALGSFYRFLSVASSSKRFA